MDFYANRRLRAITDVTRRFYPQWDEEKYRHDRKLFALDEDKKISQLSAGMRVKYMLVLALGAALYALLTWLSFRKAAAHFEKVDL